VTIITVRFVYMFGDILLSSWSEKCFRWSYRENQNTTFIFSIFTNIVVCV